MKCLQTIIKMYTLVHGWEVQDTLALTRVTHLGHGYDKLVLLCVVSHCTAVELTTKLIVKTHLESEICNLTI